MKAMPQSAGSATKKLLQASRPPAEAPIPTIGKLLETLSGPRANATRRLGDGRDVFVFRAELFGIYTLKNAISDRSDRFTLSRLRAEISQALDFGLFVKRTCSRDICSASSVHEELDHPSRRANISGAIRDRQRAASATKARRYVGTLISAKSCLSTSC